MSSYGIGSENGINICTICSACAREPASSNAISLLTSLSKPLAFHLLRYAFKPLKNKCLLSYEMVVTHSPTTNVSGLNFRSYMG